jgi:SAM-dependent methyltransferase
LFKPAYLSGWRLMRQKAGGRYNAAMPASLSRTLEPEWMDDPEEAVVYARADFSDVNRRFVADLLAACGPLPDIRALDLGCGPADIPLRLAEARPGWRITAMDASWAMLKLALADRRFAGGNRVLLLRGSAQAVPVRSGSVDLIFSNSLLHHLPDPMPLWRELRRLGARGARVFVRDLMRPDSAETARRIVQANAGGEPALLQEEFHRSLLAAFTPDEVRGQLEQTGLGGLTVQPVTDRHMDVCGRL